MPKVTAEVPAEVLAGLPEDLQATAAELRLAAAAKWYELGRVSQEQGARIAGLSRDAFIVALGRLRVPPLQETADEALAFARAQE